MPPALFRLSCQRFFQDHSDGKLWVDDSRIISTRDYGCTKTQDVTTEFGSIPINMATASIFPTENAVTFYVRGPKRRKV